jgi:hypothetical protein
MSSQVLPFKQVIQKVNWLSKHHTEDSICDIWWVTNHKNWDLDSLCLQGQMSSRGRCCSRNRQCFHCLLAAGWCPRTFATESKTETISVYCFTEFGSQKQGEVVYYEIDINSSDTSAVLTLGCSYTSYFTNHPVVRHTLNCKHFIQSQNA